MPEKKPLEFKARKEMGPNGKEILVIDPICETITHDDGRQDVIVHLPALSLINECKQLNGIE